MKPTTYHRPCIDMVSLGEQCALAEDNRLGSTDNTRSASLEEGNSAWKSSLWLQTLLRRPLFWHWLEAFTGMLHNVQRYCIIMHANLELRLFW